MQTGEISGRNPAVTPSIESSVQSLQGGGRSLPESARSYFEPRFGCDFSNVRVHTDSEAGASARAVEAKAFTLGRDIFFGQDQYSPESIKGKHLLAHELTHVVQQAGSPDAMIHRAPSDFRITDINPSDAANTSMIFFELNESDIPATEQGKIASLAVPAGAALTLNGFSSEEGSDAVNDALIERRLRSVDRALRAAGHTGVHTPVNLRASGVGQMDYRRMRSVEVLPTPSGLTAAPSSQSACSAPGAINAPCGTAFASSFPIANIAMTVANIRLALLNFDTAAAALVARLFAGVPTATVINNMRAIGAQVNAMQTQHQCHSSCDAGCDRPAYCTGAGIGPSGAILTLCPDFLSGGDLSFQAQTIIHESAHGTAGVAADDISYMSSRQIAYLSPADAVRNTDSYVLLAWLLTFPGSVTIGPATQDTMVGMTPAEEDAARRAIAFAESWLNYGDFDTSILYDTVHRSLPPAASWASESGDDFNRETMHLIAPIYGLTDPGAVAPFALPTNDDKIKIAAIHDRYNQMYSAVDWQVLTVTKGPAGSDQWTGNGAQLPRLGQTATVGPAFFGMTPTDRIKHIVKLMAEAMFGISAAFHQKYVDALDAIRIHRGLGP